MTSNLGASSVQDASTREFSESGRFVGWTNNRDIVSFGTNAGATELPFQRWHHFKEAFTPELVKRAIQESPIAVRTCLDPFAGSGTSALASQFLSVKPIAVELNPYLADLIEAKLSQYDTDVLVRDFRTLLRAANRSRADPRRFFASAPPTFVEPGSGGRWIFGKSMARRLANYVNALDTVRDARNRRLFRVLLGGILIDLSNVVISGKGRRYRRNWEALNHRPEDLDQAFCGAVATAVTDIVRYSDRAETRFSILRGDCRRVLTQNSQGADLAIFSPPYPNSFDYTDIYNIELWALRYLLSSESNTRLRLATLSSHVQIKREFALPPEGSPSLIETVSKLIDVRKKLWNRNIPEMVGGYFADMLMVIRQVIRRLPARGQIWMVIGDSCYAGVHIPTSTILQELSIGTRYSTILEEPFRAMRASPQQGGDPALKETLLVLEKSG